MFIPDIFHCIASQTAVSGCVIRGILQFSLARTLCVFVFLCVFYIANIFKIIFKVNK